MDVDRIYQGDCRAIMRRMIGAGVRPQCVVTSPPYWALRDYGVTGQFGLERTWVRHVARMRGVFRLVREILRDDGLLFLNYGDCYAGNAGGFQGKNGQRASRTHTARIKNHKRGRGAGDIKPKDLVGMPWRVAFALQHDGWWLRSDIVWCLSGGASVYARTQKGDMPMMIKDLVRLDPRTVKLWNGDKWTQALGWSQSTDTTGAVEFELGSGERIACTPGHQWPTERGLLRADEIKIGDRLESVRLPEPDTLPNASALNEQVAWLCGMYLAEGSMSGDKIQISGHLSEATARLYDIQNIAAQFHGSARAHIHGNTSNIVIHSKIVAQIIRTYVHGEHAGNKGMKARCWARHNLWLENFLRGYLEGDGHYDRRNKRWRLGFTRNDRLADDLRTLCARLGCQLTLKATTGKGFGRDWKIYRGDLRTEPTYHRNARKSTQVVAIRASRARQFWDIGVADKPHVFALSSGVLTHNSKPNPMPESIRDRPTKSHEYIFMMAKSARYYYDADAIREPGSPDTHARLSRAYKGYSPPGQDEHRGMGAPRANARRPGVNPKATANQRPIAGWADGPGRHSTIEHAAGAGTRGSKYAQASPQIKGGDRMANLPAGKTESRDTTQMRPKWCKQNESFSEAISGDITVDRNVRTVWNIATEGTEFAHFATFPRALVARCILASTRPGDIVFDPFAGSGTTCEVAESLGRRFIGAELNPEYIKIFAQHRKTTIGLAL